MKKILLLGAAAFQMAPILYSRQRNYYIITCDNRPNNPGHALANKSYFVSTIDKHGILEIAKKEQINGIITFGSDASAPTVAFVCEQLKLPGNSINSIEILTNKKKFRQFLNETKIQPINFKSFKENEISEINAYLNTCNLPIVIKPVDSAGSKGVSIINDLSSVKEKIEYAFNESISKEIIIETYIEKIGNQICGDGYFENGKIKYIFFGDGHFYDDKIHQAPWGETFPSKHAAHFLKDAKQKIEKILQSVNFTQGQFNHDVIIDKNGKAFIIEIGPRGGGNFIPDAIKLKYGIDLVADSVESAIRFNYNSKQIIKESHEHYSCYMLHSFSKKGIFRKLEIDKKIQSKIFSVTLYIKPGEEVFPFTKGSYAIGHIMLKFSSFEEMTDYYRTIHDYFKIIIDG